MSKVVLDITLSLDGFIAGPNDDVGRLHDWLLSGNTPSAYNEFFKLSKQSARVDEIQIHLALVLLDAGIRLFDHLGTEPIELETTRVIEAPGVTHLKYRIVK